MNHLINVGLAIGISMLSVHTHAGLFDLFNKEERVNGVAMHMYEEQQSDQLSKIALDLHKQYGLFIAQYKRYTETYIGNHNKDTFQKHAIKITEYRDLRFVKSGDRYDLYTMGLIINLENQYSEVIEKLFNDIKTIAHHVSIEGTSNYGRGGTHLIGENIEGLRTLTLKCKKEIYSDASGGNSCTTTTDKIDFSNDKIKVSVSSSQGKTEVPKENLKNWSDDYWNNRF